MKTPSWLQHAVVPPPPLLSAELRQRKVSGDDCALPLSAGIRVLTTFWLYSRTCRRLFSSTYSTLPCPSGALLAGALIPGDALACDALVDLPLAAGAMRPLAKCPLWVSIPGFAS